ncbi:lipoprotein LipO [Paenibacillus marchantiophytorum]|uniref:Lipoprotein LipO n=1 Tax=Paenibacillus marchantiophytorum TaxID=1619310 RepID=A0ABQ2BTR8_9BACL|nr:hypothetical protein [Paenibacillus marchantiophytorum]GGI46565.1 lipoprotein LipO [Paenibacillus marchantiophytorum]
MRKQKKMFSTILTCTVMITMLAACSKSTPDASTAPASNAPATAAPASSAPTAAVDQDALYFGKYDPPITITTVRRTVQGAKYKPGDSADENNWTRLLKEHGIIIKTLWSQDASEFVNKMNVSIATSDIPELIPQINSTQANTLIAADGILDMKPYLDKYLSPQAKQFLYSDPAMMSGLMKDGKQLLMPSGAAEIRQDAKSLYIRKDWLDKLKLPVPTTLEQFRQVSDAFTHQDPDGNGKDDTYGYGIAGKDNLILDWGGLGGFFEMYKVQPGPWYDGTLFFEKDPSGKAIWSGAKPAMRDALSTLQDMYKKGELAKDFGTVDAGGKLYQDIIGSKVGMFDGRPWMPNWPLPDLKSKVPTAEFIAVNFPSADGAPTKPYGYIPGNVYKAVSKNTKHPEAIVQMINLYVEKLFGKTAEPAKYNSIDVNDAGSQHWAAPFILEDLYVNSKNYTAISAAIKSKDASKLDALQKGYYDDILKYQADPKYIVGWSANQTYSGAENTIGKHYYEDLKESDITKNLWFSFPTSTMAAKAPTYKKMAEEAITKIIYGQLPITDWDKTVASWNKLGGDEILKEVQSQVK